MNGQGLGTQLTKAGALEAPGETAPGIPRNGSVRREALLSEKDGNCNLEVLRLCSTFRQGGWEIWGPFKGQMPPDLYFRHSEAKMNVNG